MIRNTKTILSITAALIALSAGPALAASIPGNLSLHNTSLPADVDVNGQVNITDLNLVVEALREHEAAPLVAPLDTETTYLWDTSGNGRVNSADALVVINYMLTAPVPEPTTVITAGLALAGFAGICWRRRRVGATARG